MTVGSASVKPVEEKVAAFVTEMAETYGSHGLDRKYLNVAPTRETVYYKDGDWGWEMRIDLLIEEVMSALTGRESVVITPEYYCTDYYETWYLSGNTLIEISLDNQYLWFYLEGRLMTETPVVTGNVATWDITRKGVFEDVNLKVRSGEILGMAGLVGAGRSEVMRALVGYDHLDSGTVLLNGQPVTIKHPKDAVKNHIIMASEDRKELGLVLCRSIKENVSLQNFDKLASVTFINKVKERREAKAYTAKMATKMNSIEDLVSSLSGGNQQKVVLAKCMMSDPKVLILDEPTRGIDVGAKAAIYDIMVQFARQGIAIIMISSEMPELIGMSDRIIVMEGGHVRGELEGEDAANQETILKLAFGGEKDD